MTKIIAIWTMTAVVTLMLACNQIRTPGIEQLGSAPSGPGQSVNPGINEPYFRTDLNPETWAQRFEVESREIYAARHAIADAVGLSPGMRIADVGAGTGLFVPLFAERVGQSGKVYAVDIAPAFVSYIERLARRDGLEQVEARLCREDSIDLPDKSVDIVFVCDTYHHFEYPAASLASIHRALVPDGELVVIDFQRIPGVSSEWILDHVRADEGTVISEVQQAGFALVEEMIIKGLDDDYALRFRKEK